MIRQSLVFHGAMPALDLALTLWMMRPAPTHDLEVGLPLLIHALAGMLECITDLHQDAHHACNQVMSFQKAIDCRFRDKVEPLI